MSVKKVLFQLTVLLISSFFSIVKAQTGCGTPANLQVSVSDNVVTFSWTGTQGADIHAILLRNEQTGENSKGYSSVGADFATMTVPPGTYAWRVISLCNTAQRVTEDASEWVWGTPFTMSKTNTYIPQAHAGCDQYDVPGTSTGLSAMSPLDGTGQWTVVSGTGGSFGNVSNATSTFTGVAGTTYILRWTVSNENGSTFHDVLVSFCTPPSQTNAGIDQLNVIGTSTTLAATAPQTGTGVWTVVSGEGGGLGNAFSATSTFLGSAGSTYVLRWTVSNVCGSSSDDVTVSFCTPPSQANAGSNQLDIVGTSTTLAATIPAEGTGQWSVVSGTGGNFGNTSSATSTFTGTADMTYVLRWTVSKACGSNSDDITVSFCTPPSQADAGADQLDVPGTITVLTATAPQTGTGIWRIVSGEGGGLGNASSATSTFVGRAENTYVLRWTVSNVCGSSSDDVTVSFAQPLPAYGTVTDIDGNSYYTIQIGTQTWMAENLKTTRYNDGTTIPNVTDNTAWQALTTGAWSYYDHNAFNNNLYGKLYNWYAVNTGKLCPQGWHIPTNGDWTILSTYLGGESVAGGKMKPITANTGATNESGFSGRSGGVRFNNGSFYYIDFYGFWWSSTEYSTGSARHTGLNYSNSTLSRGIDIKESGLSCRCVRD